MMKKDKLDNEKVFGMYTRLGDVREYDVNDPKQEAARRAEIKEVLRSVYLAYNRACGCCPNNKPVSITTGKAETKSGKRELDNVGLKEKIAAGCTMQPPDGELCESLASVIHNYASLLKAFFIGSKINKDLDIVMELQNQPNGGEKPIVGTVWLRDEIVDAHLSDDWPAMLSAVERIRLEKDDLLKEITIGLNDPTRRKLTDQTLSKKAILEQQEQFMV